MKTYIRALAITSLALVCIVALYSLRHVNIGSLGAFTQIGVALIRASAALITGHPVTINPGFIRILPYPHCIGSSCDEDPIKYVLQGVLLVGILLSLVAAVLCVAVYSQTKHRRWFAVFVILTVILVLSPLIGLEEEYEGALKYALPGVVSLLALIAAFVSPPDTPTERASSPVE